jgi:hypothetical protein
VRIDPTEPPRRFSAEGVTLTEVARIRLEPDELITFTSELGGEYDVVGKDWGFFATPSVNSRLPKFGLRTAVVADAKGKRAVVLVHRERLALFEAYLERHGERVEEWLDER